MEVLPIIAFSIMIGIGLGEAFAHVKCRRLLADIAFWKAEAIKRGYVEQPWEEEAVKAGWTRP